MSAKRQAAAVVTAAPVATSLPAEGPGTVTNESVNSQLPPSQRGPIGNIAASSSNFVVSSIGGMFSKMTEYFEMQTISDSRGFGDRSTSTDDFDDDFYDSLDHLEGHPVSNNTNDNGQRRGIFAGISSYFQPSKKYQAVPTHNNDNNNRRRDSSSVDGDLSNSSFSSFQDHMNTSFCEPYPLIDESVNGEGVYVDDGREGEGGEGHKFVPTQLLNIITWCDKCGELIWGFYKQCLRCTYCKYTCHYKCLNDVGLDCMESPELRKDTPDHSPQHTLVSVEDIENELESFVFLTREELEPKIDKFNTLRTQKSESLTLNEEGTLFSGRVTVNINLARPVSVRTGCPLPDICVSTLKQYEHSIDTNKRRTTFFMPKATSQELNITCYTTAQDVIRNVLAGLQLIDNPRKFALFERTEHNGEVFMRKMVDEDRPLYMCLSWTSATGSKRFELRENETGVIEWEAFTVPELQNFLRILDKEEEEYIQAVRRKYIKYQTLLQDTVDSTTSTTTTQQQKQSAPIHQKQISA
ncbi:ras association domain-containing protein 1 isoform X1 [Strongylocentrotus purpuratus]|uniref:Ras association domain-containing protein 1 n=1 Tax=Strongylocentrotus purpuratus TaxID=7668 RepID=A0A7M7GHP6_STRPU|nr:ras association domain-containing protein 1 isoform X1 [Strongylocentrotus purpuratus]XP_030828138.1 ras association domain-containing protein 1 isoform X1 [Strongylocentrotus purpuratus]|eukprot:XP_003726965.1 PREDICTED: ras association domain-containing protein 1 isoform X3 [Strongylocentrotus purpuratus]